MNLIQASWSPDGRLFVWGESGTKFATSNASTLVHPSAMSIEELLAYIAEFELIAEGTDEVELALPSDNIGPLVSPRLYGVADGRPAGEVKLVKWRVPSVQLGPLDALLFLTSLPQQTSNTKCDDSVYYWLEATKLILELLAHGRFLPTLEIENGGHVSRWRPILSRDDDTRRVGVLLQSLPDLCLGFAGGNDPARLIDSFISISVDCLVREFLARRSLVPTVSSGRDRGVGSQVGLQWLSSLTASNPALDGAAFELAKLEVRLRRWSAAFSPVHAHPVRTAFRLVQPRPLRSNAPESEHSWLLELLIQSALTPDQLLRASDIWSGNLRFLERTEHSFEELEGMLLRDLAQASTVFKPLRRALDQPFPSSVQLSTAEAYMLLREASPTLEDAGFSIIVPAWWREPTRKVGLHLTVSTESEVEARESHRRMLGVNQLLEFSWDVSLGEHRLGLDEFRELVNSQSPLVFYRGEWVELRAKDVEKTMQFLEEQKRRRTMPMIEALRLSAGEAQEEVGLPVVGLSAHGWVRKLLQSESERISLIPQPPGFEGELRPYQQEGLSWLTFLDFLGCGACLADDMGLGKTIQLLALLTHEREMRKDVRVPPTLLIVPMSILDNWEQETKRFTPALRCYLHHGPTRLGAEAFQRTCESSDLIITTYSLAYRDHSILRQVTWRRIVLDEAQHIKNLATKQTQAIRQLAHSQLQRTDTSYPFGRLALTGTPLENHLEELWSILDFLNPGYLGSISDFRARYAIPIERYRDTTVATKLSRLVQPMILRRLKTDRAVISDLPEKIEMELFTSLTQEQAVLYQRVVNSMLPQVEQASGIQRKGLVLATITRLKQICNHPVLFLKDNSALSGRSGKLALLEELLEVILAEGDRVLIFTQFATMGHLLRPYLQERFDTEVLFLHGGLTKQQRDTLVRRFQGTDGPSVFILSLKAGGFGLNLTNANQIVHFDQWWNPAVEDQAADRAYRIGQRRNVQVRKLLVRGTLEERIALMVQEKRHLADTIVGSTKGIVTELPLGELRKLLELTREADFEETVE